MTKYRKEKDFLGTVNVPYNAYYGPETARTLDNYKISGIMVSGTFIKYYAILKRCAAVANMKTGKLDTKIGNAVVKACDDVIAGKLSDQFTIDVFQSGAGTATNMNVNEVIANRAIVLLKGKKGNYKMVNPHDHVNMSQSTNDTYPAVMHMTTYFMVRELLIPALRNLQNALSRKSKEFSAIVKTGRTHLQDAVPMTLGQEFSGYSSSISRQIDNMERSIGPLLVLSLGGTAVGTGIEASPEYSREVIKEINRYTHGSFKVAKNFFDIQQNQIEESWVSSALRDLAIELNKIANDLRLMNSGPVSGFGDIVLPAVQPGSSIMPGKVNPSMPEMLNMVCFEVIGNDTAIAYSAESGQLELNVYMPLIAYNLVYSIGILSNAINTFVKRCVVGIKANKKRLESNVERDMSLATALAPYIGYSKAAHIARKAYHENKTVKQVCLEMRIMPEKELDRILNPRKLVKKGQ
ncbi:MAG: aspartate ammonia-lyase [Candidatus Marsarchaeota archaeon]|nr:aspartate ammonia-lyase [Candidatus Marsarchaeota archaeon]